LHPRAGAIDLTGTDIAGKQPREVSRLGVVFVPQEGNIFPSLSIEENLEIGAYLDRAAFRESEGACDSDTGSRLWGRGMLTQPAASRSRRGAVRMRGLLGAGDGVMDGGGIPGPARMGSPVSRRACGGGTNWYVEPRAEPAQCA